MIGEIFGKFTIIEEGIRGEKEKRVFVRVRCECGKEGLRRYQHLVTGRTVQCKNCSAKQTAIRYPPYHCPRKDVGLLTRRFYCCIRAGARVRRLPFELSMQFLWDLYLKQNQVCALSGWPIYLSTELKRDGHMDYSKVTASLDRISSSLGYTENNVWWVHKKINRFKNNYSYEEFTSMCSAVAVWKDYNNEKV